MKTLFAFIIFQIISVSCNRNCRSIQEVYPNNEEKIVFTFPDCDDTSFYKREFFYDNGKIGSEGFYRDGLKTGKFKRWSKGSVLLEEWNVKDGKEDGFIQCWYPNGKKKREAELILGVENGIWRDWNEDGLLVLEGYYKNGMKEGRWKSWAENGSWNIKTFQNGKLSGDTYEYIVDSLETYQVVGQYKNGVESGLWKWFDKDSVLYQSAVFEDGKIKGSIVSYK